MIQNKFIELSPYLYRITVVPDGDEKTYNLVQFKLKPGWKIDNIPEDITYELSNEGTLYYSKTRTIDEIIEYVNKNIIQYNIEQEMKNELLVNKINELKTLFQSKSLDELQKSITLNVTTEEPKSGTEPEKQDTSITGTN